MRLYLFRHAEAGDDYPSDFQRELTERGRMRTTNAGRVLRRMAIAADHIYTSPRVRARQTARILADALDLPLSVHEGLDFSFDVDVVAELFADALPDTALLLVGHNPSFETVLSDLTGARATFKKGMLARIDLPDNRPPLGGYLVWLIPPKAFDYQEES